MFDLLWKVIGGQNRKPSARARNGRLESGVSRLRLEALEDRSLLSATLPTFGTIIGQGTTLKQQDSFNVNVQSSIVAGAVVDSGQLTFSDAKAGDTFQAATITSISIVSTSNPPVTNGVLPIGYFTITGTASLNGSAPSYSFVATGSLPVPTVVGSTGGVSFQASGPNGFSYAPAGAGWDAGQSIVLTLTPATPTPTTAQLAASASPAVFGQSVAFTASIGMNSVSNSAVTGAVSFKVDQGTPVSATLSGGKAVYSTSALTPGSHTITASYAGSTYLGASQATFTEVVNQASTATSLTYSGWSVAAQPMTLIAAVSAVAPGYGKPTGAVSFYDSGTLLGNAAIAGSTANLALPGGLSVGPHSITAVYNGDGNFVGSTSISLSKPIAAISDTTTLTTSASPVILGNSITLTAKVAGNTSYGSTFLMPTPTGTVQFVDGSTVVGNTTLNSSGVAQLTVNLPAGERYIQAVYGGDANFGNSTGSVLQVVQAPTTLTLTPSANPSVFGQSVAVTAKIALVTPNGGTIPPGPITFVVDGGTPANVSLGNGTAVLNLSNLSVGNHTIAASYAGNWTYAWAPAQAALTQVVNKDGTATALTYSGWSVVAQPITFTASVAAAAPGYGKPTGAVSFYDSGTLLGNAAIAGSTANLALPGGLSVGPHSITAVYNGDGNFVGSTSTSLSKPIAAISDTTAISTSVSPVVVGMPVTFTATIAGATSYGSTFKMPGPATGTVQFLDGAVVLGNAALNASGAAQLTTSFATAGTHSITAVYGGDTLYASSTSSTLSETVTSALPKPSVTVSTQSYLMLSTQPVTFSVYVGGATGIAGNITLYDGSSAVGTAALAASRASFTLPSMTVGSHSITAVYGGSASFASAASGVWNEQIVAPVANTIAGTGTTLAGQDSIAVNVQTTLAGGVPSFSGSMTFADSKAGLTFNATSITSAAVWQLPGTTAGIGTDTYFVIMGTATQGTGSSAIYNFMAMVSLPITGVANSTGGLIFQVTGPNGYSYSDPWAAWGAGESLGVTYPSSSSSAAAAAVFASLGQSNVNTDSLFGPALPS